MKRTKRRKVYQKLKRSRWKKRYYWGSNEPSETTKAKLATTATPCSCCLCGNPRKYFSSVTRQEVKIQISEQEFLSEFASR